MQIYTKDLVKVLVVLAKGWFVHTFIHIVFTIMDDCVLILKHRISHLQTHPVTVIIVDFIKQLYQVEKRSNMCQIWIWFGWQKKKIIASSKGESMLYLKINIKMLDMKNIEKSI